MQIIDRDSGKYTFSITLYMLELYQVSWSCCLGSSVHYPAHFDSLVPKTL